MTNTADISGMGDALADLLSAFDGATAPDVDWTITDDGGLTVNVNGDTITVPAATAVTWADRLASGFERLHQTFADMSSAIEDDHTQRAERDAAATARAWTPSSLGLIEHPEKSGQWRTDTTAQSFLTFEPGDTDDTLLLHVAFNDLPAAVMSLTADGEAWHATLVKGRDYHIPTWNCDDWVVELSEQLDQHRRANPLDSIPAGIDAVRYILDRAEQSAAFNATSSEIIAAYETRRDAEQEAKEAVAREWRRKSRSDDHIPTGPLKQLCKDMSYIDYAKEGYATGGYRVDAIPVVSEKRPDELVEPRRRSHRSSGSTIGAVELFYVVRLEKNDATFTTRRKKSYSSFYDSDLERIRESLPGCVVKAPETKSVVFVARDLPEHVEALDAAIVEWVFSGDDRERDNDD